jgi:hypothetical protein
LGRRTYGKDTGEDIREGYEPPDDIAAEDLKGGESEQFTVGEDEDGPSRHDSEESRQWQQARAPEVLLKPKYGVDGEAFENVWNSGEPSEPPKENP